MKKCRWVCRENSAQSMNSMGNWIHESEWLKWTGFTGLKTEMEARKDKEEW